MPHRYIFALLLTVVLWGCGRSTSEGSLLITNTKYTLEGPAAIDRNVCTAYEVKRFTKEGEPAVMSSDFPIQPGLVSGAGGVFVDAGCKQSAIVNVVMPAGKNTATFYFLSPAAGTTVLEAGDVIIPKESRGTLSVVVR